MSLVLIVEGLSDKHKILSVFPESDIEFIVTGGTKFNNRVKTKIEEHMSDKNHLFLLTDPDEAGDQIAKMIQKEYMIPRILVDPSEASYYTSKGNKYGVEHCSKKYIENLIGGLVYG